MREELKRFKFLYELLLGALANFALFLVLAISTLIFRFIADLSVISENAPWMSYILHFAEKAIFILITALFLLSIARTTWRAAFEARKEILENYNKEHHNE